MYDGPGKIGAIVFFEGPSDSDSHLSNPPEVKLTVGGQKPPGASRIWRANHKDSPRAILHCDYG